jgi:hypothetical protein
VPLNFAILKHSDIEITIGGTQGPLAMMLPIFILAAHIFSDGRAEKLFCLESC